MDMPKDGPMGHNLFVRGAAPIGKGFFLVDGQNSASGKGKVWRPYILRPNPEAGKVKYPGASYEYVEPPYIGAGVVKPAQLQHRKGQWAARLYAQPLWCEAFFPTEARAVQFLIFNAPEFFS